MHPVDQAVAYHGLHERGATLEQIANRFGTGKRLVARRIRLMALAPPIMAAPTDASPSHIRHRQSEEPGTARRRPLCVAYALSEFEGCSFWPMADFGIAVRDRHGFQIIRT